MKERIITGVILIGVLVAIISMGEIPILALVAFLSTVGIYEYYNVVAKDSNLFDKIFMCIVNLVIISYGIIRPEYILELFLFIVMIIFAKGVITKKTVDEIVFSIWGLIYVSIFFALAIKILFVDAGLATILLTIVTCIICDTMAYFVGVKLGRHKLCEAVSPKKSVEGSIGGFLSSAIFMVIAYFVMTKIGIAILLSLNDCIVLGLLIGIFAQFGDLSASMIKRKYDVKDYGHIFPGHGGVLDRVDSIMFTLGISYIYLEVCGRII